MRRRLLVTGITLLAFLLLVVVYEASAWEELPVDQDPLLRMPGTQPDQGVVLDGPGQCLNCHEDAGTPELPGNRWQGSMMAQAGRDPLFWATLTVALQDSIWALGNPNAGDLCLRCHMPIGWLGGRSDPTNASTMGGADFDGVECTFCHRTYDPFFEGTFNGTREGDAWETYWDEATVASHEAATTTYNLDSALAEQILFFNGDNFYVNNTPPTTYTENGGGQYFVDTADNRRASFADAEANHPTYYSRYHKSKFFCSTCHDVSNAVLANLGEDGSSPLPSELNPAYSYFHVERTFSEFMVSAYGQQGGAPGIGPYDPASFETSTPNDYISRCQDCHMPDTTGKGCKNNKAVIRPTESTEHPNSGVPLHDMNGGNIWVSRLLASTQLESANYDATISSLLDNPGALTMDLTAGEGVNGAAMLEGAQRAEQLLQDAAAIEALTYDVYSGTLSFRVQNQTGHKLISGYPEGRRMFLNVKAYDNDGNLIYELNPYDEAASTLKGLDYTYTTTLPAPAPLSAHEVYSDALVYEMHAGSTLTGESETHHFVLADHRYKDNRIPPKGFGFDGEVFNADKIAERLLTPAWKGVEDVDYFTQDEYGGGYDQVTVTGLPRATAAIEVDLYYQVTSREYIEFLNREINGTATTLSGTGAGGDPPYLIQSDPFFDGLRAWGDTIWQVWENTRTWPGAAPFLMTQATWQGTPLPAAPDLAGRAARPDAVLYWPHASENAAYEVYSNTLPYFRPDQGLLVRQITPPGSLSSGEIISHTLEEALADAGGNSYYRVEAENETGEIYSNRVGIFHFALTPGSATVSPAASLRLRPFW